MHVNICSLMNALPFHNRYITLGDSFYQETDPSPVIAPRLIRFNEELAADLGIDRDGHDDNDLAAVFSGNVVPDGARPVAMAYAGHQFGNFVPQLGDGRAILLGEINGHGLHFKGSGQTVFSRNGDGRAALGPVLREYLVSEAMHRLGVPTTRALAAVTTGEEVARDRLLPGGIITRVASSFVRVGTFEFFRARGDVESIRKLADHVISHHYSELADSDNPYAALLQSVTDRQAKLIAQWMHIGFIHGVMNTDNMSVTGDTIDYGPCAFMDEYRHDKVFSSIDHGGRYAYHNQPAIGLWNLTRLAECLLPLIDEDMDAAIAQAEQILGSYRDTHENAWLAGMRSKCGLLDHSDRLQQQDQALVEDLLDLMEQYVMDFTLTFHHLTQSVTCANVDDMMRNGYFPQNPGFRDWLRHWEERLQAESVSGNQRMARMRKVNPVYIPRNHQVEAAIRAAEDNDDFSVFHELHEVLQNPFVEQDGKDQYMQPPEPEEVVLRTFCGT